MSDVVVLDDQIVAVEQNAEPRTVVDQVVRRSIADTAQRDAHALFVEH